MAEDDAVVMDPEFPQWYRAVSLNEDRELLERRWAGVASLTDNITGLDIETIVCTIFRSKQRLNSGALARIQQAFKDADDLFNMRDNERELEVLCGAALSTFFKRNSDLAATAALAVSTAAFSGARTLHLPIDLTETAEHTLTRIAESRRARPDLAQNVSTQIEEIDFSVATQKIDAQQNWEGVKEAFATAAATATTNLRAVACRSAGAIKAASEFMTIQDEELQMLWWLMGERSWDMDCEFSKILAEARPAVLAKELADHTEILPGPASVKALLSRTPLPTRKKLTVPVLINACDPSWLEKVVDNSNPSPVSQPIHFAIQRKLETGDDSAWIAGWAAVTDIEANYSLPALTLGNLFYRERLLSLFSTERDV